jgi:hypothetical protein
MKDHVPGESDRSRSRRVTWAAWSEVGKRSGDRDDEQSTRGSEDKQRSRSRANQRGVLLFRHRGDLCDRRTPVKPKFMFKLLVHAGTSST